MIGPPVSFALQGARPLWAAVASSSKALASYEDCPVQFQADDGEPKEMPITAISVANCKYFGGGMMVAPDADPPDGIFDGASTTATT